MLCPGVLDVTAMQMLGHPVARMVEQNKTIPTLASEKIESFHQGCACLSPKQLEALL